MVEKWKLAARRLLSKRILLSHGGGGRETSELIEALIRGLVPIQYWKVEGGTGLDLLDDSSYIPASEGEIAVTIDSYTVDPIIFPGGDIGLLAASGTINDLLMGGAIPLAALDALIVEEGLEVETLAYIINSMVKTLTENNVALIGGDFKVVPKGGVDKIIVSMVGIGRVVKELRDDNVRPGDKIIVSGPIGTHGAAILSARGTYGLKMKIESDVQPLTPLMIPLLENYKESLHAAGDPTRGGLAMLLNEWAKKNGIVVYIDESKIPVKEDVRAYADVIGVDPLVLANEGVAVLAVDWDKAEEILDYIRSLGYKEANIIGEARKPKEERHKGIVVAKTAAGGYRILEAPSGEIVPRIC
ncbi:MAG: hydrogenase expression/formation protein HypE [Desulfurococcales archaeon]|nr:hydrogenase expression/formation protein HypE [Desulfurococcales archaeon]